MQRSNGLVLLGLVVLAVLAIGGLAWLNAQNQPELIVFVPTQLPPTDDPESWRTILEQNFGSDSTPLPTVPLPTQNFQVPTLPFEDAGRETIPLQPATVGVRPTESVSTGNTPTPPPADTPTPLGQNITPDALTPAFTEQALVAATRIWQPPPLIPPLSRDAFGRDHYWFTRPVDSNATNFGLFYYPYGSDGPESENPWRVHHGIDMPNPVGETVRAAGSGRVIWAADSLRIENSASFQNSPSYGNVVVIEHDFGYRGQPLYTLYAHLSAVLVQQGMYLQAGEVIGLVGQTGRVSGPHVHFEVRMGENLYRSTYNPVLWMVPYVGHGVIAGRLLDRNDNFIQDADITLRRWSTGLVEDTTTSYVFLDSASDVNPDPVWQENFTFADVPVGRYEVIANIEGRRLSKIIDVYEGTTSLVELKLEDAATPQALLTPTPEGGVEAASLDG